MARFLQSNLALVPEVAKARELLSQYPVKDQCQNSMKVTGLAIAIRAS
jgi:hypothetical protein